MNLNIRKKIFFPILDFWTGYNTINFLEKLNKSQWLSKDESIALQWKDLKKMIDYSSKEIPFYIDYFKNNQISNNDFSSIEDLKMLPLVSKSQLRKIDRFMPKRSKIKFLSQSTSGSTGEPFNYLIDKSRVGLINGSYFRTLESLNYQIGQKMITIAGAKDLHSTFIQKVKISVIKNIYNSNPIPSVNLNDKTIKMIINKINLEKPKIIRGHPSALEIVSKYLLSQNIEIYKPGAICTFAEKLYKHQEEIINRVFKCKIYEGYGGGDIGVDTFVCENNSRHVCSDTGFMEIIDSNGLDAGLNQSGEIVTSIANYSMARLRYKTSDFAMYSSENCSCGRSWPIIKEIIGRKVDILNFSNGRKIVTAGICTLFKDFSFDRYQIIRKRSSKDNLLIKIIKGKNYIESDADRSKDTLKNVCGDDVKINYEFVKNIPETSSGKKHFIIEEE